MKLNDINQSTEVFENDEKRHEMRQEMPWRKDAPALNKKPTNPDYPTKPFNHDEWMKSSKKMEEDSECPMPGDTVRTNKSQMDGKVEKVDGDIVYFRIEDGRLMKTSIGNVTVVEKLADDEFTEGGMGGINQCAPAQDVSYEHVLDEVKAMWEEEQLDELSVDKMKAYVNKAKSSQNFKQGRSLGKIAKTVATGVPTAVDKINAKTGNRTGNVPKQGPIRQGPTEESADPCWKDYHQIGMKNKKGKQVPNCVPVEEKNMPGDASGIIPSNSPASIDPWHGNPKKLSKAPKTSMQGSEVATFDEMVKDTIEAHGLKWAFDYYVKKHGLSPRQFAIYAGLNANPEAKPRVKDVWTDPSRTKRPAQKEGWWANMRGKLPFEE